MTSKFQCIQISKDLLSSDYIVPISPSRIKLIEAREAKRKAVQQERLAHQLWRLEKWATRKKRSDDAELKRLRAGYRPVV